MKRFLSLNKPHSGISFLRWIFHALMMALLILGTSSTLVPDTSTDPTMRSKWVAENEMIARSIHYKEMIDQVRGGNKDLMRYIDFLTYQKWIQIIIYERDRLRSDPNYADESNQYQIREDLSIYQIIGINQAGPIISFFYGVLNTDPRIRKRAYYHVRNLLMYYNDYTKLPLSDMMYTVDVSIKEETVPVVMEALTKMKRLIQRMILVQKVLKSPNSLATIQKEEFKALAEPLDEYDTPPIMQWDDTLVPSLFSGLQNQFLYVKLQCVKALKNRYTLTRDPKIQQDIRVQFENLLLFIDELDLYLGYNLAEEVAQALDLQPKTPDKKVILPKGDDRYQRERCDYNPNAKKYGFGSGVFEYSKPEK